MAQALAMQKLERVNDIDIAEVHQSKTLFDGIEQETRPLNSFIKILYAFEWLKLEKQDETAIRAWLDGQYGDPFEIARGRFTLGATDPGDGHIQPKNVFDQVAEPMRASATRFASILNKARDLVRAERFQNWQVAYPGVWTQWESGELHGGFHAVVGNPPYVRQELIKPYKAQLKRGFPDTYDGSADLYVYFYDQGLKLLKPGGRLSYVVTNKWMRAGYAEGLRGVFADKAWVEFVADFGHAKKFFPDADVFPSVIVVRKPIAGAVPTETQVCVIPRDDVPEKALDEAVAKATYPLPRAHFTKATWALEPPKVVELLEKLRRNSIPLKEFVSSEPLYGIKTGLNEAFLIDQSVRDSLVRAHPTLRDVIRPYLRGQDIRRWSSPDSGLFMILMRSSNDFPWPWHDAVDEASAERVFKHTFPALHTHFKKFEQFTDPKTRKLRGLRHREDKGRWWWELRPCAYYAEFDKPKICIQRIAFYARFSVDTTARLVNDSAVILPKMPTLLAGILNQPIAWYYQFKKFPHKKDEALAMDIAALNDFPVPSLEKSQSEFLAIVDSVTNATALSRQHTSKAEDWLRHQVGITSMKAIHGALVSPNADAFVTRLRAALPKKQKLTATDIAEMKREYVETIEPAKLSLDEIFTLENKVSALVNKAYDLTSEEAALMWRTAPPRMPFTPSGLTSTDAVSDNDDE
jgi:hypothetical protein